MDALRDADVRVPLRGVVPSAEKKATELNAPPPWKVRLAHSAGTENRGLDCP